MSQCYLNLRVGKALANDIKEILLQLQVLDKGRLFKELNDGTILVPINSDPTESDILNLSPNLREKNWKFEIIEDKEPDLRTIRKSPFEKVSKKLSNSLPKNMLDLLPQKWESHGKVLVIKVPKKLEEHVSIIARTYAEVLGSKCVLQDIGGIKGVLRQPNYRVIYGHNPVALHKENGISYKFDASKIMFSSGNITERTRMAKQECRSEVIVDMFSGIGYFSLPMAKYTGASKVISCELNPVSFSYLKENIEINDLSKIIYPIQGDNRQNAPNHIADRIIMGYLHQTHTFLPKALKVLKQKGGIIHYHDISPVDRMRKSPVEKVKSICKENGRECEIIHFEKVKSYAPMVAHIVLDLWVH